MTGLAPTVDMETDVNRLTRNSVIVTIVADFMRFLRFREYSMSALDRMCIYLSLPEFWYMSPRSILWLFEKSIALSCQFERLICKIKLTNN